MHNILKSSDVSPALCYVHATGWHKDAYVFDHNLRQPRFQWVFLLYCELAASCMRFCDERISHRSDVNCP